MKGNSYLLIVVYRTYHHASVECYACAGHDTSSCWLDIMFLQVAADVLFNLLQSKPFLLGSIGVRLQKTRLCNDENQ